MKQKTKTHTKMPKRYYPLPATIRGRVFEPPTGEPFITIHEAIAYAEDRTQHNRRAVEDDRLCGCAHCLNFFPGRLVREWVNVSEDEEDWALDTAACPYCGHDAVLASIEGWPMSVPFFLALNMHLYPHEDGYCDPHTVVFRDCAEEQAALEREEALRKREEVEALRRRREDELRSRRAASRTACRPWIVPGTYVIPGGESDV